MTRLPDPSPSALPEPVRDFLTALPPDPMVRMLSHSAGTVRPFVELARAQFTALDLPARSRELVILAVAARTGSTFVGAQHEPMADAAGVEEHVRRLVREGVFDGPGLAGADRALLRFTDEVLSGPSVPDDVFEAARRHLSDRELVEVLQVIGYYWTFGRISTVLDVPVTRVYGDEPILE
ncbi:hypothetical protein KUM39_13925 [Streptomyces sp. J2-1]|uniref:carboxymuconolactone decarboxylase family protein n=1 Tax=Streptomyces corallincola TaxID=2851888 RepID=UPI001C38B4D2|nr:hypothetical protein [Streptomyces corallincola]MBV2355453.1 hypothetical protein [Streptomyces corallincola]